MLGQVQMSCCQSLKIPIRWAPALAVRCNKNQSSTDAIESAYLRGALPNAIRHLYHARFEPKRTPYWWTESGPQQYHPTSASDPERENERFGFFPSNGCSNQAQKPPSRCRASPSCWCEVLQSPHFWACLQAFDLPMSSLPSVKPRWKTF